MLRRINGGARLGRAASSIAYAEGHGTQCDGSVLATLGGTVVHASAVVGRRLAPNTRAPLSIEYKGRVHAAGRIPSNYWREERERPSKGELAVQGFAERALRPLLPRSGGEGVEFAEVRVAVLALDGVHPPDVLALNASSAALWAAGAITEPVGVSRIALRPDGGRVRVHRPRSLPRALTLPPPPGCRARDCGRGGHEARSVVCRDGRGPPGAEFGVAGAGEVGGGRGDWGGRGGATGGSGSCGAGGGGAGGGAGGAAVAGGGGGPGSAPTAS